MYNHMHSLILINQFRIRRCPLCFPKGSRSMVCSHGLFHSVSSYDWNFWLVSDLSTDPDHQQDHRINFTLFCGVLNGFQGSFAEVSETCLVVSEILAPFRTSRGFIIGGHQGSRFHPTERQTTGWRWQWILSFLKGGFFCSKYKPPGN